MFFIFECSLEFFGLVEEELFILICGDEELMQLGIFHLVMIHLRGRQLTRTEQTIEESVGRRVGNVLHATVQHTCTRGQAKREQKSA